MLQTCPYNRCADVRMRENPEVERSKVLQLCRNKIGRRDAPIDRGVSTAG